jgi:hypothetical protein
VEHGRTGFLVDTVEELAAALRDVGRLSRDACRRAAEERFSLRDAMDRYLARYRELAALPRPPHPAPLPPPRERGISRRPPRSGAPPRSLSHPHDG